ncbi:hypothetical protein D3C85_1333650 [compost metagenome]
MVMLQQLFEEVQEYLLVDLLVYIYQTKLETTEFLLVLSMLVVLMYIQKDMVLQQIQHNILLQLHLQLHQLMTCHLIRKTSNLLRFGKLQWQLIKNFLLDSQVQLKEYFKKILMRSLITMLTLMLRLEHLAVLTTDQDILVMMPEHV